MQRLLLLACVWGLLALTAVGCGGDAGADGSTGSNADRGTGGDADSGASANGALNGGDDAAALDAGGDGQSAGDSTQATGGDAATGGWQTPVLELGTNEQGKATPKDFVPVADNAVLDVVKGPQGLWMVVLAFRTCGLYTQPLLLRAKIETDDKAAGGTLDVAKQKLNPAPDGLQYYYNFWLVVQNPELSDDKMATVTLKIEDSKGKVGEHTLRVKLRKQ